MKFLINLCTFVGETKIQETGLYNWYCICLKTAHNMPRWKKGENNCGNNICAPCCPNTAWPLPVAIYHSLPLGNVLSNKQVKTWAVGKVGGRLWAALQSLKQYLYFLYYVGKVHMFMWLAKFWSTSATSPNMHKMISHCGILKISLWQLEMAKNYFISVSKRCSKLHNEK